jgi:putative colanic acid biosynthesis acetyltransferase WcaF
MNGDPVLDINANRAARKYTPIENAKRVLWGACRPLFRLSPRPLYGWRRWLLRVFGARVGNRVRVYPSVRVFAPWEFEIGDDSAIGDGAEVYNLGPVRIGTCVTVSQNAYMCAGSHDYTKPDMPLTKPPVVIEDQAWICAFGFVGPGVTIGEGAVVGAYAVVVSDVDPWSVVAGNPARHVKTRQVQTE